MDSIILEVTSTVSNWIEIANRIGIPKSEQEEMGRAFV